MNRSIKIFLFIICVSLTGFVKPRLFPRFNYRTVAGSNIDNQFFARKKTIVIIAHLGCPPAMFLFSDIPTMDTTVYQFLIVLENSISQLNDFNAEEKNAWSDLRKKNLIAPLKINVIAECENENIKVDGKDIIIGPQCRKLSKKIKTKDSPTLVYVNEQGEIVKIIKGYFGNNDRNMRVKKLLSY